MAGATDLRNAADLYHRLKVISCPCLEGCYLTEPQTMYDLLCTPSAHRLDILEWICTRVYPPLQDQFSSLKESQSDVKIKEMVRLGFELLLCGSDDLDLIKGHAPPQKQLSFIRQLMDIIQNPGTLASNMTMEPAAISADKSVVNCVRENEELLKDLFFSPQFQATLYPECTPWPADLKPLLLSEEPTHKRPLQSSKDCVMGESLEALQKISASLQALKEECEFLNSSVPGSDTILQTLRLALTDFYQLIAAFTEVYDHEFQEHCGHPAPQMSPSGPLFQSVHESLTVCSKELEAIAQFTETSENIAEVVRKRQHSKESWGGSRYTTLYEKIKELKQNYEAFQGSLQE
ncbi:HAUS augmin-like complex subunit 7 [Spea bombifrons]|uniref:HAUS augmin-like complex subunit 7 n=1 Tax=Spea bombifrons TaxID=233779 RepID=UPI002349347F|nr:HAUS augmin-like complex subunit 7 [Spea bombifrons]